MMVCPLIYDLREPCWIKLNDRWHQLDSKFWSAMNRLVNRMALCGQWPRRSNQRGVGTLHNDGEYETQWDDNENHLGWPPVNLSSVYRNWPDYATLKEAATALLSRSRKCEIA